MPIVALNGRFSAAAQPTGTQTASFHLFDEIAKDHGSCELVIFADTRFPGIADWARCEGVQLVHVGFQDWSRARAHLWEQIQFPVEAKRHGCSIAHHPMTTCPSLRLGVKSVVTVHDLNFYCRPEWYSRSFRLVYRVCAVPGIRRADRIVTVSKYVEDQARKHWKIPRERIETIYNGVKPLAAGDRAGCQKPYILCVGSLQPHKNLPRIIKSYLTIRNEFPDLELHVVGRQQAHFRGDSELPNRLAESGVKQLGYLSEKDLAAAYAGAAVFCFPSLEEGFGLPVLEAMSVGTPVVTSNTSCLPETAGPAVLVDPYSVDAIANGLRNALSLSPDERLKTTASGRNWAARFSWREAASRYVKLYEKLANSEPESDHAACASDPAIR